MAHIQATTMKQNRSPLRAMSALLALVFSLSHLTESHGMDNSNIPAGPIAGASSYYLTPEEQATLALKAEAGDAEAAFRLSKYHSFVRLDHQQELRWLRLAAEGGHASAQYNLAADLYMDGNDLAEAAHWASESQKNGKANAGRLLQEIEAARAAASRQPGK